MARAILNKATRTLVVALAVQLLCAVCVCEAQSTVDVGISAGMSRQSTGPSSLGGVVFVDREFTPRFSVGSELAAAAAITGQQQLRSEGAIANVRSRHHDAILSAVAKYRISGLDYFDVALVAGGGAALRRTIREGTAQSLANPRVLTAIDDRLSNVVAAGTVGFDGAFHVSPRAALVLTARWYLLNGNDRSPNEGAAVFTFGGGGRVSF